MTALLGEPSGEKQAVISILNDTVDGVKGIAKGMGVTLKEMFAPTITENYPEEPPHFEGRYRGVHVLQRDKNGLEKCVACLLCSAA